VTALQSITYHSTSEDPTITAGSRTVNWTVTDANSDVAGAGTSTAVTSTINITPINDAPTAINLIKPRDDNIIININNIDTTNLIFEWSSAIDSEQDSLKYIFYAEWDTANQIKYPINTVFNSDLTDTMFIASYQKLYEALDYNNRVWINQPILKWKVDVSDYTDTTFCEDTSQVSIGYFDVLDLELELIPTEFNLYQNYPNPYNSATRIEYDLPINSMVSLKIYNLLGQEVVCLKDEMQNPGHYSLIWNGHNNQNNPLSSGIYIYILETQEFKKIKKMILLK
jgi:hypothetical protein